MTDRLPRKSAHAQRAACARMAHVSAGLGEAAERVECGVESPLTAPVRLVVGLGGHVSDQFVQLVVAGHQDGTVAVVGAGPHRELFAYTEHVMGVVVQRGAWVRKTNRSQSGSSNRKSRDAAATSAEMTISWTGPARVGRRRRRSNDESAQLLMTPSSPQALHRKRIASCGSLRSTTIRPGHERLAGRRRHGSALSHAIPTSPAVAARTMQPWSPLPATTRRRVPASSRRGPSAPGQAAALFNNRGTTPRPGRLIGANCRGWRGWPG